MTTMNYHLRSMPAAQVHVEFVHDDCNANDKAFTTLAKKVGMDVGYF